MNPLLPSIHGTSTGTTTFAAAVASVTPCTCSARRARAEAAEQAVQRVRELHAPMQHGPKGQRTICVHCFCAVPLCHHPRPGRR